MGLYVIDKTFCSPQPADSHSSTSKSPPHKRMRPPSETSSGASTPMHVNNGTGYAGGRSEDVSWKPLVSPELMSRHRVRRLLLKPRLKSISPLPKSFDKCRRTYRISTEKVDHAFPTLWSIRPPSPTSDGRVHSSMISYETSLCST